MENKKLKTEERLTNLESFVGRELCKEIPAKLILPERETYLLVICGKCGYNLGTYYPLNTATPFYVKHCQQCGNKVVFDEKRIGEFKPLLEERKKLGVIIREKDEKIRNLQKRRKPRKKTE